MFNGLYTEPFLAELLKRTMNNLSSKYLPYTGFYCVEAYMTRHKNAEGQGESSQFAEVT